MPRVAYFDNSTDTVTDRDYSLGGHEWVDPVSGIDSWDGKQGAD